TSALDASPIYLPLCKLLDGGEYWDDTTNARVPVSGKFHGTTRALMHALRYQFRTYENGFPRSERALAAMLARITPNLRAEGIEVRRLGRHPVKRVEILEITKTFSKAEQEARDAAQKRNEEIAEAELKLQTEARANKRATNEAKRAAHERKCQEWLKG